jgi:nucleoside-diphosphate-sugar epimerase
VARTFNTYGPRLHPYDGRVVSNFIIQALTGGDLTIYGDGRQTRSFCYSDDLVDGLIRLMATGEDVTGPINLGNPAEIAIGDLAEMIRELTGSRSQIVSRPAPARRPAAAVPGHRNGAITARLGAQGRAHRRAKRNDRVFSQPLELRPRGGPPRWNLPRRPRPFEPAAPEARSASSSVRSS